MNRVFTLTESEFRKMIRRILAEVLTKNAHEVKYFHPTGRKMPNGSHYQRGGFLNECRANANSWLLDEGVHGEQYGLAKYRGGIITFSTDINALQLSNNVLLNKLKQFIETFKQRKNRGKLIHKAINRFNKENEQEGIGAYSVGNFFRGKYVGDNGEMFNEKSLSVEVNGLSSASLLQLAEFIAEMLKQETVLVKDLNNNKIYLADAYSSDISLEKEMERINTEC